MPLNGYCGRIAEIDLSLSKCSVRDIPQNIYRMFLGGKGIAVYLFARFLVPHVDPLDSRNPLIFATGPLQGTMLPGTGRFVAVSKSPLTSLVLDSYCGGFFGPRLKSAGVDAITVTGVASNPCYIVVEHGTAKIVPANDLWGLTTDECESIINERYGKDCSFVCIGPAGERLVRIACLISQRRRALGRGGLGAVSGSKKLKAIVAIGGHKNIEAADPDKLKEMWLLIDKGIKSAHDRRDDFLEFGTSGKVSTANQLDRIPTRNFQKGQFEDIARIEGENLHNQYKFLRHSCSDCAVSCSPTYEIDGELFDGPEYETLSMLGSNVGVSDPKLICKFNELCNRLGLDTISTGNVIGFGMELNERGYVELGLRFGDGESVLRTIEDIGLGDNYRGKLLGQGVKRVSELVRKGADFAMHVKGLEMPGWDPRGKLGAALAYATADVGASHNRDRLRMNRLPTETAIPLVSELIETQNQTVIRDSLVLCTYILYYTDSKTLFDELLTAVTGLTMNGKTLDEIGERVWTLTRMINVAEGISRENDSLPPRIMNDPLPSGVAKGCRGFSSTTDLESCLDEYYRRRGWDNSGVPTLMKIESCGLIRLKSLERIMLMNKSQRDSC